MMRKTFFVLSFSLFTFACSANTLSKDMDDDNAKIVNKEELMKLPLKDIVKTYYDKKFYLGTANHAKLFGQLSTEIMDREFNYVTPSNDFKQSYIHPTFDRWRWENSDAWIQHANKNDLVIRIHGPISPQTSPWAREDDRTKEEMSKMLDEYMIALCNKYGKEPSVLWLDVVNETIVPKPIKDALGNQEPGEWFGPREGTDKWENPWTILGFDESSDLKVPIYIDRAFELANTHAPSVKQIINQHGNFEEVVWEKMKELVHYLRVDKGRKVDGLGWQAHIDMGWEKIPGNLERLDAVIKWCHKNNLEFHVTEMNVWNKELGVNKEKEQAETYTAVLDVLLKNSKFGVTGLNFWNIRDEDTPNQEWKGCLWDNEGRARLAYDEIKKTLINNIK